MDNVSLYWTIVVGIISVGWVLITFIRDRISQSVERTNEMVTRLLEDDKLIIENPEIQMYLSQNAKQDAEYFRNEEVLKEPLFYKAKAAVYKQISMFDEILSISSRTSGRFSFLKPPSLIEISDWEVYIKVKLRHPLYLSILKYEKNIFGKSLRDFWKKNEQKIVSLSIDPFIW